MVLERIKKVIKAFPKENWENAKCPYCFGNIIKCGTWPYYWNECKRKKHKWKRDKSRFFNT